jgi:phage gp36-like protein
MSLLFTPADITARMSTKDYERLYSRNGGNTVDTDFRDRCMADADSEVRVLTKAAFPTGFDAAGGTVDPIIVRACVAISNANAAEMSAGSSEKNGYSQAAERYRKLLKAFTRDDNARVVTSAAGLPDPQPSVENTTQDDGVTTNSAWTRAASGQDGSNF